MRLICSFDGWANRGSVQNRQSNYVFRFPPVLDPTSSFRRAHARLATPLPVDLAAAAAPGLRGARSKDAANLVWASVVRSSSFPFPPKL